ncbi:MAG TPA: PHB depolymerase family esterase [Solirubrobacter sp.]
MSIKLPVALVAAAAALAVPSAASAQAPTCATQGAVGTAYATGVNCRTLIHDGDQRRFEVYVPATVGEHPPVVFMFHGSSGTGEQFLRMSGWRQEADRRGVIAVFPTGERYLITDTGRMETKWADFNLSEDTADPPADDVGFVDDMLADLEAELPVDTHRIYASGFSNGAGFAARLAVDRADTFAAVAFSGGGLNEVHTPSRPVPTYSTVGTLDDRVLAQTDPPLTELPLDPVAILTTPRLESYISVALQTLGLDEGLYGVMAQPHSTSFRWPATGNEPVFRFAILDGVTHEYPNGTNNPNGFTAASEFADFFAEHRLP